MKILFFSDIHGITNNLSYIEKVIENNNFDKIVVLGDLYYSGPNYDNKYAINSKEVKEFLTKYQEPLIVLRGNCDSDVDIKASDFPIMDGISLICVDGLDIYCTHGNNYSFDKNSNINRKGILVYGHEHLPYIKKDETMYYICVGSISLPRNNSDPTYMIYNNNVFTIYDTNGTKINQVEIK